MNIDSYIGAPVYINDGSKVSSILVLLDDKLLSSQLKYDIEIIESIEDIQCFGIETELNQVLVNIIKNSVDELVKKSVRKIIFVNVYKEKNKIVIKIKDNAGGISENILDRIFLSHFTTKESSGGTGLGLYMCKTITEESFQGAIEVKNSNYEYENISYSGAEFSLEIPLQSVNI